MLIFISTEINRIMKNHVLIFIILFLVSANFFTIFSFTPTWDFPVHLYSAKVRLHEIVPYPGYKYLMYGIITDVLPLLFSRIFPQNHFPSTFLAFSVICGSIGIFFFYLFVKKGYGKITASLSTIILLLLPRFIGHLHTNIKDTAMAAFFISASYFLYRYLSQHQYKDAIFTFICAVLAVNTKLTVFQLYPVYFLWLIYHFFFIDEKKFKIKYLIKNLSLLAVIFILPVIIFFILWPDQPSAMFSNLGLLMSVISNILPSSRFYALEQLIYTTPIPVLVFIPFGLFTLLKRSVLEKHSISFFFLVLFLYTLGKHIIFGVPIIDDIRYILEICFPVALTCVLGVKLAAKKMSLYACFGLVLFLLITFIRYHPYQITYNNILGVNNDPDFWAASYKDVFGYLNRTLPEKTRVSVRFAPELANYYLRPDLQNDNIGTVPFEKSDVVVILNRPSNFNAFRVTDFVSTHIPDKIFKNPAGIPLTFIYYLTKQE